MKKIIFLFIVSSVLVLNSCSSNEKTKEVEKAIPVRIVKVENKVVSIPIYSSGKISSESESKLSFKTGGIIKQIFFDEGQTVQRGQILAQLDLGEIQAKVNLAKAGYTKAERDFQRVEALYKDSVVTLEQLQNVKTGLDVAKSNMEIAEFNLNYSKISAPSNGKILKRFVEENELVGPGTPIIIFGSIGSTWIMRVGITDKDITRIQYKNNAKVIIDALPTKSFDAIVSEVASAANPYNGTYEIELTIKTDSKNLISGMVANAKIFPNSKGEAKIIPIEALVNADGKNGSVFIPTKNNTIAKKINVKIDGIIGTDVVVKIGLDNVLEVITDGVEYLTDGEKIKETETGERKPEKGNE
ncbi:MAG: efflux RND transporter periplasmic adaptor subunit [Ignavibacteriae bacterium]|nr:efflux RND transporter periplasmic adaptor subunit [Ignavibacteriota bacterium]